MELEVGRKVRMTMELYRHKNCEGCQAVQDALKEMVLSYTTINMKEYPPKEDASDVPHPPVLVDDGRVIQGEAQILEYLESLRGFQENWYKYQSHVCYCEDDE